MIGTSTTTLKCKHDCLDWRRCTRNSQSSTATRRDRDHSTGFVRLGCPSRPHRDHSVQAAQAEQEDQAEEHDAGQGEEAEPVAEEAADGEDAFAIVRAG